MPSRVPIPVTAALVTVVSALVLRAVTVHSTGVLPLIYRLAVYNNDLDQVEGLAPPGSTVELWFRQRNFVEGNAADQDPFRWCRWKNDGHPLFLGRTVTDGQGVWRLSGLRAPGHTSAQVFPPGPGEDRCVGGLYTELLPRTCDAAGNCTATASPTLHWLDVRKRTPTIAVAQGSVVGAEQTSIAVADGPDDGPNPSDVVDVDQNGVDTTQPGLQPGQLVVWKCGPGGTLSCPSVTVHDGSTAISTDPEYPFVLGTMQAHRAGGSFIAAAAIPRGTPVGFTVNVNVKLRGRVDINLGCDQKSPFDFLP
jgi:hypothetical protein